MSGAQHFLHEVDTLIRARYPLLYLVTWEEQRVEALLGDIARAQGKDLLEWSGTKGLRNLNGRSPPIADTEPADKALEAIATLTEPSIVLLKDFHRCLADPRIVRSLRELGFKLKSTFTTVLITAPVLEIPPELEKELTVIDVPLPTRAELLQLLRDIARVVVKNKRAVVELTNAQAEALVSAAQGLTLAEAENAFAKAIAEDNRLDGGDIRRMLEEKSQVVRKSGLLEYHGVEASLADIGGQPLLKRWLERRKDAFSDAARKFGLPEPKGLLLLGVQGCGKSLTAKAIASGWRLPLLRLDMGRIFSGLIGSSEENVRRAIKIAESLAPVILWVDEIEKGLAGTSGQGDSGTSARVFGSLLTWMQEKTAPVFVVATANRIEGLPPELLRKGRFDEIFFVDLPGEADRAAIFDIQLKKRGREAKGFPIAALARQSEHFSGAEIEQAIISAMYDAFADGVELEPRHIEVALKETVPLAVTMSADIARLREWARSRTRPAA
jgi:ATP-dependent 26S proteasome regulatory subunit